MDIALVYEYMRCAIRDYCNAIKNENYIDKITDVSQHHVTQTIDNVISVLCELGQYPKQEVKNDVYLCEYLSNTLHLLQDDWNTLKARDEMFYKIHLKKQAWLEQAESPIEKMFIENIADIVGHCKIDMEVQYTNESPYRLDVAFPKHQVAVELDGHEFHSSKEARQRDAARDRDLTFRGWTVIRFTGSEIYKDAKACAHEVIDILDQIAYRKGMSTSPMFQLDQADILELDSVPTTVN